MSWSSFPFQGGAAGTSIPASQPLKLFPEDRAEAAARDMGDVFWPLSKHVRHLVAPYSSWPSVPWFRISNRHSFCRGCHSPGTHGRNQGIWSIGRLPRARGHDTQPTRFWPYLAEAEARRLPQLARSLRSAPHQSKRRARRTRKMLVYLVPSTGQTRHLLSQRSRQGP